MTCDNKHTALGVEIMATNAMREIVQKTHEAMPEAGLSVIVAGERVFAILGKQDRDGGAFSDKVVRVVMDMRDAAMDATEAALYAAEKDDEKAEGDVASATVALALSEVLGHHAKAFARIAEKKIQALDDENAARRIVAKAMRSMAGEDAGEA